MPRRGAKAPGSDSALTGGSVTVVSGTIRTPDDADALSVKLSIWDTELTMRVDGVELGNWETSEISIRAIDSTSFEFIAEGDQLIFTPEDSAAFAASSFVKGRLPGGGRKSRRKGKKKKKKKEEHPRAADVVPDALPEAGIRRGMRQATEESRTPKPSRRARKAAERESAERTAADLASDAPVVPATPRAANVRQDAVPTPIGRVKSGATADQDTSTDRNSGIRIPAFRDPVPEPAELLKPDLLEPPRAESAPAVLPEPEPVVLPPRAEPETAALHESESGDASQRVGALPGELVEPDPEKASRRRKSLLRRSTREDVSEGASPVETMEDEPEEEGPPQPNRLWISALDLARKYDFLGLDRVPVNESLRGQEHQHTWDHRVAPTSGPGKYICTLCGEIRR